MPLMISQQKKCRLLRNSIIISLNQADHDIDTIAGAVNISPRTVYDVLYEHKTDEG